MTFTTKIARVFPVFSITFAVIYVLSMEYNWALFTYVARSKEFHPLVYTPPTPRAVAMYWYGWLATSFLGAAVLSAIAYVLPVNWTRRLWTRLTWAVPLAAVLVLIFLLRGWFIRIA
jgi:hypothetical protein